MTKNPKESHSNLNRDSSDVKSPIVSDVARVHESNTKLWVSPLGNILDKEYPVPEPVIDGLLHLGDQCILFGKSGSGKSYITQRLCLSLAMGLDFSYYKIPKARKILYVDGEMTPSSLQKRYRKMKPKLGNPDDWIKGLSNLHYISRFIVPEFKELDIETGQHYYKQEPEIMLRTLEEQKNMQQLMNTIEIGEYEIIVLDNIFTLFNFPNGYNNPEDWLTYVQPFLNYCRQKNKCVWIIDHANKSGELFGTMGKQVTLDLMIKVESEKKEIDHFEEDDSDIEFAFTWEFRKARHLNSLQQEDVEFQLINGDIEVVENPYKQQLALAKKYYEEGLPLRKISEQIMEDISYNVSHSRIQRWAKKEGWVRSE